MLVAPTITITTATTVTAGAGGGQDTALFLSPERCQYPYELCDREVPKEIKWEYVTKSPCITFCSNIGLWANSINFDPAHRSQSNNSLFYSFSYISLFLSPFIREREGRFIALYFFFMNLCLFGVVVGWLFSFALYHI